MALNLKKSSLQRIYEYALKHIRKQGKPAVISPGGTCVYRAEDGCVCAVGAMLTDEQIATQGIRNDQAVSTAREKFSPLIGADRTGKKMDLLVALQRAHDASSRAGDFLSVFEAKMQKVADEFGLKYGPPGTPLRA